MNKNGENRPSKYDLPPPLVTFGGCFRCFTRWTVLGFAIILLKKQPNLHLRKLCLDSLIIKMARSLTLKLISRGLKKTPDN